MQLLELQLEVALADPADLPEEQAEQPRQHRRKDEADERKADPVHCSRSHGGRAVGDGLLTRAEPAGDDTDLTAQTAGAHAGVDGRAVHLKPEHARCERAGDRRAQDRRQPDARVADDVAHLEHRGAQTLRHKAAPAVFAEGQDGKADHVRAAARDGCAACQTRETEHLTDRRRRDRQRQRNADQNRDRNAHPERLKRHRGLDQLAERACRRADGRRDPLRQHHADEDRHRGRHQNVDLGFLADGLAALRCDDRNEQHRQRAACAALGVGCPADSRQREQHHRVRLQRVADGDRHRRAGDGHRVAAHVDEQLYVKLRAERLDDRADQQRAEQTLRHRAERVDAVALRGDLNVLPLQKCLDFSHFHSSFFRFGSAARSHLRVRADGF